MQIRIFTIPIVGGESIQEELNLFLRSKKILQVENQLDNDGGGLYWCFCVKYLDQAPATPDRSRPKVDYKEVLDKASFARFSKMREIRRQISRGESVPAYTILTDQEMAELAKIENLSLEAMKQVRGVGEKKTEKYGAYFVSQTEESNEKSE